MNTVSPRRPKSKYRFVFDVYRDARGQWRWRLWARNGRIVADSAESYKRKWAAIRMCEQIQDWSASSTVFVEGVQMEADLEAGSEDDLK